MSCRNPRVRTKLNSGRHHRGCKTMNCEKCQKLVSDLLDGSLNRQDELVLNQHSEECLDCAEVRRDLESIVGFCREHQGEYMAPPNERALWLRIRNIIEGENQAAALATAPGEA